MTREEAQKAVTEKLPVKDFIGENAGTCEGWASPDAVYVRWDDGDALSVEDFDSLWLQA
jgi:hypothetical protein